jgi:hypothetical protein
VGLDVRAVLAGVVPNVNRFIPGRAPSGSGATPAAEVEISRISILWRRVHHGGRRCHAAAKVQAASKAAAANHEREERAAGQGDPDDRQAARPAALYGHELSMSRHADVAPDAQLGTEDAGTAVARTGQAVVQLLPTTGAVRAPRPLLPHFLEEGLALGFSESFVLVGGVAVVPRRRSP